MRVLSAAEAGADIAFVLAATAGAGRDQRRNLDRQ
jgi:hypothetical protein